MAAIDTDVAILGGGCAGLSLAVRLAGTGLRVTVVEPRLEYEDDRVWSFFRTRPLTMTTSIVEKTYLIAQIPNIKFKLLPPSFETKIISRVRIFTLLIGDFPARNF